MGYSIEKYVLSPSNNPNSTNTEHRLNYAWDGDTKWEGIFKLILILILKETELIFLHFSTLQITVVWYCSYILSFFWNRIIRKQ